MNCKKLIYRRKFDTAGRPVSQAPVATLVQ